jgi:hypothetical protein
MNDPFGKGSLRARGKIKAGAPIFQDFRFGKWPEAATAPISWGDKPIDPDMVFDLELYGEKWDCRADGFGYHAPRGEYGCGSIFVTGIGSVEITGPATQEKP